MKEIFDKLSNYNLFNNFFPGVIFVVLLNKFTNYDLTQEDIITGAFFYYFIGMIISRFGSMIVEPFLKWIKFIKFADYNDFISASKNDVKIELLSEVNNMYRTLTAAILLVIGAKFFDLLIKYFQIKPAVIGALLLIVLFITFLLAYKKQTSYVKKRVDAVNSEND